MTKKYHSRHTRTVHQLATSLFKSGIITKEKMKEFDDVLGATNEFTRLASLMVFVSL